MDFANDGPRRPGEVGIDLGIAQTVTLSDGTVFQLMSNPSRSTKANRRTSAPALPQQGSSSNSLPGWARQTRSTSGTQPQAQKTEGEDSESPSLIRNIRRTSWLKTAHTIAQNYGGVAMEDLKLKNMTKSAKGTAEEPGKNVRQKTGLNRSLARVAPYAMRMAIHWAVFKANGRLILVDPK
ncbi:MAG: hypothetical protein ACLUNV_00040 [Sutterella wadsworthensis]